MGKRGHSEEAILRDVESIRHSREVEVGIEHDRIEAVSSVTLQQLLAKPALAMKGKQR